MHCLKGNNLWSGRVGFFQQLLEVADVIVAEDKLPDAAVPYSLDH